MLYRARIHSQLEGELNMAHQTAQRAAIRRVFEEAQRPLGPPEILIEAQRLVPRLGLTTVYRTLKSLVQDGWLTVVDLPGEPSRYERASADRHAWFECKLCKRVFQAPGECQGIEILVPEGFELNSHKLVLYGACAECREAEAAASGPGSHDGSDAARPFPGYTPPVTFEELEEEHSA